MKALARNKQTLYYATCLGEVDQYDANGFYTGQKVVQYEEPVKARMNISPARGESDLEQFGISEAYDKLLVTDDLNCPITATSVLWIESPITEPHDYVVVRVAKSLNSVTIAVRQVDVSA